MTIQEILKYRQAQQLLAHQAIDDPQKAVAWMGAIQSQDYGAAKWALGQRVAGADDHMIEDAFNKGKIIRTHVLRPTWHFVAPADIRWMLALTAPRIKAQCAHAYRMFGLDDATFRRANKALEKALQGGKQLTRDEVALVLQQAKLNTDGLRFIHLMMRAELDGVLCSGARRGKQHTYTLLEERVKPIKSIDKKEALAMLVARYFNSHGPATLQDFAWWSGLTLGMAKEGMEMVKTQFMNEKVAGQTYWFPESLPVIKDIANRTYLLPNYDEYIVSYKDRTALMDVAHTGKLDSRGNALFNNVIVINGRVEGTWKRTVKTNSVVVDIAPFNALNKTQGMAVKKVIKAYEEFTSPRPSPKEREVL